MNESPIPNGTL